MLDNATSAIYNIPSYSLLSASNKTLRYEAQITIANGQTITTNECTLNVGFLGDASIEISGNNITSNNNGLTYSLISNSQYKISTSNNAAITLTNPNNNTNIAASDIYYQ
ncbi:hypothetical protein IKS57_00540 [bacterium]|nr:hypothetical protein [bacterium]